jgi:NhaA family Na+:H+ antiporter
MTKFDADAQPGSPGVRPPWGHSDRLLPRVVLRPLQEVLRTSAASAGVLGGAVAVSLIWVNSPWRAAYDQLWSTRFSLRIGSWGIHEDLRHVVTDGLMSLFFLVVGLEIKRELVTGELRRWRAAALPAIAALGGMVVPALIYVALNVGSPAVRGWGVPMATDIAFALAVLTVAAARAPADLQPFLLTLAIVDDIGAIIVIALFYSGGITWPALLAAVLIGVIIVGLQRVHVRATLVYLVLGLAMWVAVFESGVHVTICGVVLGLLTPARPFQRPNAVSREARRTADETIDDPNPPDADARWWLRLSWLSKEAVSPLARVEHLLLPWTSFVILPLFALANAGVELSISSVRAAIVSSVALGIVLGLVVGKLVGIAAAGALAIHLGLGSLPPGGERRDLVSVAAVAGVGFTVSLFIAELAFGQGSAALTEAKVAVLVASILAAATGFVAFRYRRAGASRHG